METKQAIPLTEFCKLHRISMTAEQATDNPYMDSASRDSMDHWKVKFTRYQDFTCTGDTLRFHGKILARMTTYFSMGVGHGGAEPTAARVLDCLASDASSVDQQTFEGWARDL